MIGALVGLDPAAVLGVPVVLEQKTTILTTSDVVLFIRQK
jgi:hypothetical protein